MSTDGSCWPEEGTRKEVTAYTTWPIYQDWTTTSDGAVVWITRVADPTTVHGVCYPAKERTFPDTDEDGYRFGLTPGTTDEAKVSVYYP